jgi:hypothetical protein
MQTEAAYKCAVAADFALPRCERGMGPIRLRVAAQGGDGRRERAHNYRDLLSRTRVDTCSTGRAKKAYKQALVSYCSSVGDFAPSQEHSATREEEPLDDEGARRIGFATLLVMREIDSSPDPSHTRVGSRSRPIRVAPFIVGTMPARRPKQSCGVGLDALSLSGRGQERRPWSRASGWLGIAASPQRLWLVISWLVRSRGCCLTRGL